MCKIYLYKRVATLCHQLLVSAIYMYTDDWEGLAQEQWRILTHWTHIT